jgi:hypothetical protein
LLGLTLLSVRKDRIPHGGACTGTISIDEMQEVAARKLGE